ncbi:MAG: M56 family metallopeptidase [bacterium]
MAEWLISSAGLTLLCLAARALAGRKLGARVRYALWLPLLVRLLVPGMLFEVQRPAAAVTQGGSAGGDAALFLLWACGAALLAAVLLCSNLRFLRALRRGRRPFAPGVYVAEGLEMPCLAGLFRPTIYLTPAAMREERTLRHVLAHEETHRRHGDPLWSALRLTALCLHWFNPLVWWAVALSRQDGEAACDEGTLLRLGEAERAAYGETLIAMVTRKGRAGSLLSLSPSLSTGKRALRGRIEALARGGRTRLAALALLVPLLLCGTAASFTHAVATPMEEPTPERSSTRRSAPSRREPLLYEEAIPTASPEDSMVVVIDLNEYKGG